MFLTKLAILSFFLVALVSSSIVELNSQDLDKFISNNNQFMLYFYSPTCKTCLVPNIQYDKLAKQLNESNVKFANISGVAYKKIAQKYGVQTYPKIFFFDHTFVLPYNGPVTAKDMNNWINNYLSNRIIDATAQDLQQVRKPYVLVKGESDYQKQTVNKALFGIERVGAYYINSAQNTKITLHLKNAVVSYKDDIERIKLNKWIQDNTKTALVLINNKQNTQNILFNSEKPALVLILSPKDENQYQKYDIIVEMCEENKDKLLCGLITKKQEAYEGAHGYFKVKDTNRTIIGLVKQKMNIAYRMDMDYNKINKIFVNNFIQQALNNKIQRIVDNVAPQAVKFQHVRQLNEQSLKSTIQENKYVFLNFYKSNDDVSLFFSRPYEALAEIANSEDQIKEIIIAAFDCVQFEKQCQNRNLMYYPYLQLYVNGIPVQYDKTPKLPEVPALTKFLHKKISNKIKQISNQQEIQKLVKPFILITTSTISKQFQALPAIYDSLSFYSIKSKQNEQKIQLHAADGTRSYKGQLKLSNIIAWVKSQTEFLLADLLKQTPDPRIQTAVKNKKPILFILDSDKSKSRQYRIKVGLICKKLQLTCAYAQNTHTAYDQLLKWVFIQPSQKSRLIYADVNSDQKYLYPRNLDQVSIDTIQQFINNVKTGKIRAQSDQVIAEEVKEQGEDNVIIEQL